MSESETGAANAEQPPISRWRTLIHIVGVEEDKKGEKVVKVVVPGWNSDMEVTFPADIVPEDILKNLHPGIRLHAVVNLAAEKSDDLRPDTFEMSLPPNPNDGLNLG